MAQKKGLDSRLHLQQGRVNQKMVALILLMTVLTSVLVVAQKAPPLTVGATGISVTVRPEARIIIEPVDAPISNHPSDADLWFRVELAIRLNAGATASLFLDEITPPWELRKKDMQSLRLSQKLPDDSSQNVVDGGIAHPIFTTQKNGSYSLLVGIGSKNVSWRETFPAGSLFLTVKSSDGLLNISRPVPLSGK